MSDFITAFSIFGWMWLISYSVYRIGKRLGLSKCTSFFCGIVSLFPLTMIVVLLYYAYFDRVNHD